jgi:hypothetical protein
MVNVGLSWSSIVGIALAVSGAGLYFLRTVRPGLARDHDIFFAAVALLCGGILFFQGWRQDPILQFGQFMLAGSAIWFAFEAIRLRAVATEQAKRTTPVIDEDRPVSRVYRAELDELPMMDERSTTRRIRGSRDGRSSGSEYADEGRRSSTRSSSSDRFPSGDRPRKRRQSRDDRSDRFSEIRSAWDEEDMSSSDDRSSRSRTSSRPLRDSSDIPIRPRRPRPSSSSPSESYSRRRNSSDASSDYVDYQPINYSDDEADNSNNFD